MTLAQPAEKILAEELWNFNESRESSKSWTHADIIAPLDDEFQVTPEEFAAFTAELGEERCQFCGGTDCTLMETEYKDLVHYDCGQVWGA